MNKLERKVCSVEQAKTLFKLGLCLNSSLYWVHNKYTNDWDLLPLFHHSDDLGIKDIPAYDVAELGMLLPEIFELKPYRCLCFKKDGSWIYTIQNCTENGMEDWEDFITIVENTEAKVKAASLIRMIERRFLTIENLKL